MDRLEAVELTDGRSVERTAVFIRPALRANAPELIDSLGVDVHPGGFVRVDAGGKASRPGVWAVGNAAANPRAPVITAAAAIAINVDLVAEDIRNSLQPKAEEARVTRW